MKKLSSVFPSVALLFSIFVLTGSCFANASIRPDGPKITVPEHNNDIKFPRKYVENSRLSKNQQIITYIQMTRMVNHLAPFKYSKDLEKAIYPITIAESIDGTHSIFELFHFNSFGSISDAYFDSSSDELIEKGFKDFISLCINTNK